MDFNADRASEELTKVDLSGLEFTPNGWFSFGDSAMLYHFAKTAQRIVEVGCGYSTDIINQVRQGSLVCIDPEPRKDIEATRIIQQPVQTVDPELIAECDLLFIDSSHIWAAGDLPFLYEQVFPLLQKGTLVHSHDIFLPDDYSPAWQPRHYDEQYHLAALLETDAFEVIWPGYWMATRHPEVTKKYLGTNTSMGSLWMVKC
jgi:hypothetical protein